MLLTGMSDGGTFSLVSGLDEASPFTHLAPVAAAFHPLLLTISGPRRLTGLPIYLVHGAMDWMFPVDIARTAYRALKAAGVAIVYRELADLSHAYPRDEQGAILDWLLHMRSALPVTRHTQDASGRQYLESRKPSPSGAIDVMENSAARTTEPQTRSAGASPNVESGPTNDDWHRIGLAEGLRRRHL